MAEIEDSLQHAAGNLNAMSLYYYIRSLTLQQAAGNAPAIHLLPDTDIILLGFVSSTTDSVRNRILCLYAQVLHKIRAEHITPGNREFFIAVFPPGA